MENKTITYEDYNKQINKYNNLRRQGLIPIIKKNWIKISCGCFIIGISLITPFTNIFLIPVGLLIIGVNLMDIEELKRKVKNKIRGCKTLSFVAPHTQ